MLSPVLKIFFKKSRFQRKWVLVRFLFFYNHLLGKKQEEYFILHNSSRIQKYEKLHDAQHCSHHIQGLLLPSQTSLWPVWVSILFWNSGPRNVQQGCRVSDELRFKRNQTALDTIIEGADPYLSLCPWSAWIYTLCTCLEQVIPRPSLTGRMTICCYCSFRAFWEITFVLNCSAGDLLGLS